MTAIEITVERTAPVGPAVLRQAVLPDVGQILALVQDNLETGHLLPRSPEDVSQHIDRFLVAVEGSDVNACAELAPLSRAVAEVRSLVVRFDRRGRGIGSALLRELGTRARHDGFSVLCAFTHDPHPFVRLGFSIAPHVWFPEKVALDCTRCARFRVCGQYAMALALTSARSLPGPHRLREPLTATTRRTAAPAPSPIRLRVIA